MCIGNDSIMKLLGDKYPTSQIVFLRYLFATISIVPCMVAYGGKQLFHTKHITVHVLRAALLSAGIAMYCFSLGKLPLSTVITINFTIPIFTLLLAFIFLKEAITRAKIIATLAGFVGIVITAEPTNTELTSYAIVTLIASSIVFATLDVINKKFVIHEKILTMLFYTAVATLMFTVIPAWLSWQPVNNIDSLLFILLGVGANLLLYCILKAFERVDISSIAPFRYVEFLLSVVIGLAFFHEIPTLATIIGVCIIIPSTLYIVLSETQPTHKSSSCC
ncbi:MAG: DMT family transporter [Opitutales bacterium]|nr:DMT family transporter [Opitutales bacterium]